jgi:hypothetical protein
LNPVSEGRDELNAGYRLFYSAQPEHSVPAMSANMQTTYAVGEMGLQIANPVIVSQDYLAQLWNTIMEIKRDLASRNVFSIWQPRYIPPPPDKTLPFLDDYSCTIIAADIITNLWHHPPALVVRRQDIQSRTVETVINGAMERIALLPGVVQHTLFRGSTIALDFPPYTNDLDHKFFVANSQYVGANDAFIRVVGYSRSGRRVHPYDIHFGTFIFIIPTDMCDVAFPFIPSLNQHALDATSRMPESHNTIREIASGRRPFI